MMNLCTTNRFRYEWINAGNLARSSIASFRRAKPDCTLMTGWGKRSTLITMTTHTTVEVLLVCLGNICRSPMAEAVLRQRIVHAGLDDRIVVDSVGLGDWHIGQPPHRGTQDVLRRHGVPFAGAARQITADDLGRADYIIAMDQQNIAGLRALLGDRVHPRLHRLMEFAPEGTPLDVPDPYFHDNFDQVYDLILLGCDGLLAHIRETQAL
jgi:protein-tyrosine phosphatase